MNPLELPLVPDGSNLNEIYFDADFQNTRYEKLLKLFTTHFSHPTPDLIARSPGRVNIIGDHIDYSYFPCLPTAISFDAVMAVKVTPSLAGKPGKVSLVNTDKRFTPQSFDAVADVLISGNSWINYFKCAWITGIRFLQERGLLPKDAVLPSLDIAVSGNVPAGGGLSSSAAFVVCACLVTLRSLSQNKLPVDSYELTRLSATCEQLVGVNSGGMDQAASIFGKKDYALLVSFRPSLEVESLQFPTSDDPLVFLIANSLVVSAKLDTAPVHYNLRVVEVTLAANVLARVLDLPAIPQDGNLQAGTLYGVLIAKFGSVTPDSLHKMGQIVEETLKPDGYSEDEVADILGLSLDALRQKYMTEFPVRFDKLKLYQRAKHVYEETLRVLSYVDAMQEGKDVQVLGDLMNASQLSAQKLYENSHPDCDLLCSIAQDAGALGSRVTGAGWGGCTVHLVLRSKAQQVRDALEMHYYRSKHPDAPLDALIESRPSSGSAMFVNQSTLA